jgi:hypothetical protein
MEVSISQFRRQIFALVNQALEGQELWVTHKGRRLKIVPESAVGSRLSRVTPLDVINPESPAQSANGSDASLREEMALAWERDWADL